MSAHQINNNIVKENDSKIADILKEEGSSLFSGLKEYESPAEKNGPIEEPQQEAPVQPSEQETQEEPVASPVSQRQEEQQQQRPEQQQQQQQQQQQRPEEQQQQRVLSRDELLAAARGGASRGTIADLTQPDMANVYPTREQEVFGGYGEAPDSFSGEARLVTKGDYPEVSMSETERFVDEALKSRNPAVYSSLYHPSQSTASVNQVEEDSASAVTEAASEQRDKAIFDREIKKPSTAADSISSYQYHEVPAASFRAAQKFAEEQEKRSISNKNWNGHAFTEKVIPDETGLVDPLDMSVGTIVIREIIREPGNNLIEIVNKVCETQFTIDYLLTPAGFSEFVDAINSNEIYVIGVKSPVMRASDVQRRRLRVHEGRGVKVHKSQTVIYNLDFDGDGVSVSFTDDKNVNNAMDFLINDNNEVMIDFDFFPMVKILEDAEEFVQVFREIKFLSKYQSYYPDLVDAISRALFDVTMLDESAESFKADRNEAWTKVIRAMDALGTKVSEDAAIFGRTVDKSVVISNALKGIFDIMDELHQQSLILTADEFTMSETIRELESPAAQNDDAVHRYVYEVIGNMARGILPPNFQDFCTVLHKYAGEIEGKNNYFRLGAAFAKIINFDPSFFEGSTDTQGAHDFYELTLQAGMSMFMNGRYTLGEKTEYIQAIARRRVFAAVGLPWDAKYTKDKNGKPVKNPIPAFLEKFKEEWNAAMRLVEVSRIGFSCDMDPIESDFSVKYIKKSEVKDGNGNKRYITTLGDCADQIISVYGDSFTLGHFIKGFKGIGFSDVLYDKDGKIVESEGMWGSGGVFNMLARFENMTLREFSISNYLPQDRFEGKRPYEQDIAKATPSHLVLAIADRRTTLASKYHKTLFDEKGYGLLSDFVDAWTKFQEMERNIEYKKKLHKDVTYDLVNFRVEVEEMMAALHLSGVGMFQYFGMEDVSSFVNSEFGRMISEIIGSHKTPGQYAPWRYSKKEQADHVGGVLYSMRFMYRMRRIAELNDAIDEILDNDIENLMKYLHGDTFLEELSADIRSGHETMSRINQLQNRIIQEFEALRSVSPLWEILVQEQLDKNFFAYETLRVKGSKGSGILSDADGKDIKDKDGKTIGHDGPFGKKPFWGENGPCQKYRSLTEVLQDPDLTKTQKDAIAVDVLRSKGYSYAKAYEIAYQLDLDPDPGMTSMTLQAYREQPSMITDISKAHDRFRKHVTESWKSVVEDVKLARALANDGELDAFLADLDTDPSFYLDRPNEVVADAIAAQMWSDQRRGEKAKHSIPVAAYYESGEIQQGGMTDAMYRCEMRTLGVMPEDMLSTRDYIWVLADPTRSIRVVNGDFSWTLSRETLCGNNTEEALWDVLENNPRIAAQLRPGILSSNKKGDSVYRNAKTSLADAMQSKRTKVDRARGRIRSEMMNSPMFVSLVAMFVPEHNMSPLGIRQDHCNMTDAMMAIVTRYGAKINQYSKENPPKRLVIEKVLSNMGITVEKFEAAGLNHASAVEWYEAIKGNRPDEGLQKLFNQVSSILEEEGLDKNDVDILVSSYSHQDMAREYDLQSIQLAQDTRQTLTGAKTAFAAAIEGTITRDHLGFGLYSCATKGRHVVIDGNMDESELAQFIGCMTNVGEVLTADNIEQLENMLPDNDTPLIVEAPVGYEKADATLSNGTQISTAGTYVGTKRKMAAEDLALKLRRAGDDGRDMVVKSKRYDPKAQENIGLIESAYKKAQEADQAALARGITQDTAYFMAKYELAKILLRVDLDEGFDGMDLADYMDIAEIMIKEVKTSEVWDTQQQPGQGKAIIIRSLGEISAAIRNNMPADVIENGSPKEIIEAATEIADNVGIADRISDVDTRLHALSCFSKIRSFPSLSKFSSTRSSAMSSEDRTYQFYSTLVSGGEVVLPWEEVDGRIEPGSTVVNTRQVKVKSTEVLARYAFGETEAEAKRKQKSQAKKEKEDKSKKADKSKKENKEDKSKGSPKPVAKMLAVKFDSGDWAKKDAGRENHFYYPINVSRSKGSVNDRVSPGPMAVWVIEPGAPEAEVKKAIEQCYKYGMTLAFTDPDVLGKYLDVFRKDMMAAPFGEKYIMIPFFHIRMNGGHCSAPPAPASFDDNPSWHTVLLEDNNNFRNLADSQILTDRRTMQDTQATDSGEYPFNVRDLFYNVMTNTDVDPITKARICDEVWDVRFATWDEVRCDIIQWMNGGPSIDLGIGVSNAHAEARLQKLLRVQIPEYESRFFSDADENGILRSAGPDRIVGWMRCRVGKDPRPIYAPIIPFPTGTELHAPVEYEGYFKGMKDKEGNEPGKSFEIDSLTGSPSTDDGSITLVWRVAGSLEGQVAKFFDGTNAAGKGVTFFSNDTDLGSLLNGRRIDHIKAFATDKSRKVGTARRQGTMEGLAITARDDYDGFNFAELPGAFAHPDIADIKEALQGTYVSKEQWKGYVRRLRALEARYPNELFFSKDPVLNGLVRELIYKADGTPTVNPTDLIACRYRETDAAGNVSYKRTCRYVDYDFFYRTDVGFENALLKFYNTMFDFGDGKSICPPSIDSYEPGKYLIRPISDMSNPDMYGVLTVGKPEPVPGSPGKYALIWHNLYRPISFYNNEYTGVRKPGLNGSARSMEQIAAAAISGLQVSGPVFRSFAKNAISPSHKLYKNFELHVEYDYSQFLPSGKR